MNKKLLAVILVVVLSATISLAGLAEGSTSGLFVRDVHDATDEELEYARKLIILEQRARIKTYVLLDQNEMSVARGKNIQLNATVEDLLDDVKAGAFAWVSSDESVATVNQYGTIRAVAPGNADITCSCVLSDETEISALCKVTVYAPVERVSAQNNSMKITRGQTEQIVPVISPADATNPSVSYSSSDESVATVSDSGMVTAVSVGSFQITVTALDGSEKNCVLWGNVLQDVQAIELDTNEVSVPVGKRATLKAVPVPGNAANQRLQWTSDDESVATVNEYGQITGVSLGETTVHAEAADGNGAKADCKVVVVNPVSSITLSEKNLNLIATVDEQLTAEVLPEDATNRTIKWSSSDDKIASVDQTGHITPKEGGRCTITAEATDGSGVKAQATVTIKKYDVVFTNAEPITITYDTFDMSSGMFTMDWNSKQKKVNINGSSGHLTLTPVAEGEDTVTVTEKEYFSGKKIKKSWTVYVMPGVIGK